MHLRLEPASGSPVYQQIVDQIKRMVAAGTLRKGDRLPTVRELASQLIINPNTVAHAYQSLERDNIIETRRGLGSFISEPDSQLSHEARIKQVSDLIERALVEAHHLNVSSNEVRKLLEDHFSTLYALEDTTHE